MTKAILTTLFTLTFVVSPAFTSFSGFEANQLPIPQVDPPIQPAGYAFSIWGLIYAWLVVSAAYGLWQRREDAAWDRARLSLIASLAIGTPWLYVATQSAILATIMIIAMAVTAIAAMIMAPQKDRWLFQAPVAIYAGWLTAASCVSIGSTMAGYGIAFESLGWAYAGISIALVVSLGVYAMRRSAPEYLLTVVWALVGIIVANGMVVWTVSALAAVGIVMLLAATILMGRAPKLAVS
ncbi:tryptophan-rich sensory protein [Yoonia sp. 208BN28-4]|uniref:tryptophan-rich sensory protein n=1 Tax=Yoonia sp. 208BN28-4 TaxID=3126505 RepID=UPI00309779D6